MQDNNEAGASPAPVDRLDELEQWANDLPRRLAGGSDRGITRWAVAELQRLRNDRRLVVRLIDESDDGLVTVEDLCGAISYYPDGESSS